MNPVESDLSSQAGGSIRAAKHKLISFRSWPWWMTTKANNDIANRKRTYLFYGNVNCTSEANGSDSVRFSSAKSGVDPGLYVSHVICAWLSFKPSRIILYCASFKSYIRQNFGFFLLLTRIVGCLANARQQQEIEDKKIKAWEIKLKSMSDRWFWSRSVIWKKNVTVFGRTGGGGRGVLPKKIG